MRKGVNTLTSQRW